MTLAEAGARIEKKIEEISDKVEKLSDKVNLLLLMHNVCPECYAEARREDAGDFWHWVCSKCGRIYGWNKEYFPKDGEDE